MKGRPRNRQQVRAGDLHCSPLVRQFFEALDTEGLYYSNIADKAGLSQWTVRQWRYKAIPTLICFEAALNAIGLELCIREKSPPSQSALAKRI